MILAAALAILLIVAATPADAAMAVIVTRAVYPGQVIVADMLTTADATRCTSCRPGFIERPDDMIGLVATKTLLPGRPIYKELLRAPFVVEPGKPVNVVYTAGGLTITMRGLPLKAAGVGDAVAVRNSQSGATVTGIVRADGSVIVGGS